MKDVVLGGHVPTETAIGSKSEYFNSYLFVPKTKLMERVLVTLT